MKATKSKLRGLCSGRCEACWLCGGESARTEFSYCPICGGKGSLIVFQAKLRKS